MSMIIHISSEREWLPQRIYHRFMFSLGIFTDKHSQPESLISKSNIFNNLPAFNSLPTTDIDEISRYLNTGPKDVKNEDLLTWWYKHKHIYPHLYCMALDYHTILGKSSLNYPFDSLLI